MPEIWLKYGNTQVALDVKLENLQAEISPSLQDIAEAEIVKELRTSLISGRTLVLTLSKSKAVDKVASLLSQVLESEGSGEAEVRSLKEVATYNLENSFNIGSAECPLLLKKQYKNVVFVSRVCYDPLFGFSGTPTLLLRQYMHNRMLQAYESRKSNIPTPGVICPPFEEALSSSAYLSASSVEIISSDSSISGIFTGKITEAFRNAVNKLSSTQISVEQAKSLIIGGTAETDIDLVTSLNLLWNSTHVLQEGGSAALIAENRKGLGKGALQMLVEGKLRIEDLDRNGFYTQGLEHLLYLRNLRDKLGLGIVSTLPCWYLSKLGLQSYRGSAELLNSLLNKHGKKGKILVSLIGDSQLLKVDR
jgi:hypothetical protein